MAESSPSTPSFTEHSSTTLSAPKHPITFDDDNGDLLRLHHALQQTNLFLGNPSLLDNVCWLEQDGKLVLVIACGDKSDPIYQPAILSCVGDVNPDNSVSYVWHTRDADRARFDPLTILARARAITTIGSSDWEYFSKEWSTCLDNMRRLIRATSTGAFSVAVDVVNDDSIVIGHSLLQV
jgi:hypothetical protein